MHRAKAVKKIQEEQGFRVILNEVSEAVENYKESLTGSPHIGSVKYNQGAIGALRAFRERIKMLVEFKEDKDE